MYFPHLYLIFGNKGERIKLMTIVSFPLAEEAQLTPLLRLGAGACAGIIAMSATYPMDMVRGRLTVQVSFRPFGSMNMRLVLIFTCFHVQGSFMY